MKVVIAGGSGFLGTALIQELSGADHELVVLATQPRQITGARVVQWDGATAGPWTNELEGAEAVVNYAGAPLFTRWTEAAKDRILTSRVKSTLALNDAIRKANAPPRYWLNGSAIGFYGDRGSEELTETSPVGAGFLAEVTQKWEEATQESGVPTGLLRTGITLGSHHPPLSLLVSLTNSFAGGSVGSGSAFFPWIWVKDHARLARFCIEHRIVGPINAVAPQSITNGELMHALRKALHRPWAPPVPTLLLKGLEPLGFPFEAVAASARVLPEVAKAHSFQWEAPTIADALAVELPREGRI